MNVKWHITLILCLILILMLMASCVDDKESESGGEVVRRILDLTLEDFAEPDFNSIFLIESIRSVYDRSEFREGSHTANSLDFTFVEGEFVTEVKISVERNSGGLVTKMYFNDRLVTGEPGGNYFSSSLEEGDLNNLPSVIQFDLGYNSLAMPHFYSVRPLGSIMGLINDGLEINGMYRVQRYLVEMLIMERILASDSIVNFAVTNNVIYALMRPTDSEAGEYLLWFDGKYLTMAGNLSFARGL